MNSNEPGGRPKRKGLKMKIKKKRLSGNAPGQHEIVTPAQVSPHGPGRKPKSEPKCDRAVAANSAGKKGQSQGDQDQISDQECESKTSDSGSQQDRIQNRNNTSKKPGLQTKQDKMSKHEINAAKSTTAREKTAIHEIDTDEINNVAGNVKSPLKTGRVNDGASSSNKSCISGSTQKDSHGKDVKTACTERVKINGSAASFKLPSVPAGVATKKCPKSETHAVVNSPSNHLVTEHVSVSLSRISVPAGVHKVEGCQPPVTRDNNNVQDKHKLQQQKKNPLEKSLGTESPVKRARLCMDKPPTVTCHAGVFTEPEFLGPCEPGTNVKLQGIVWQETPNGMLVLNVTWKGKTFVGTLIDSTNHEWASPRLNSSKPKATSVGPSSHVTVGERRLRSGKVTPGVLHGKSGKTVPKRRAQHFDLEKLTQMTPLKKRCDWNKPAKEQTEDKSSVNTNFVFLPDFVECPEPGCCKKYSCEAGLEFHQAYAHRDALIESIELPKKDKSKSKKSKTKTLKKPGQADAEKSINSHKSKVQKAKESKDSQCKKNEVANITDLSKPKAIDLSVRQTQKPATSQVNSEKPVISSEQSATIVKPVPKTDMPTTSEAMCTKVGNECVVTNPVLSTPAVNSTTKTSSPMLSGDVTVSSSSSPDVLPKSLIRPQQTTRPFPVTSSHSLASPRVVKTTELASAAPKYLVASSPSLLQTALTKGALAPVTVHAHHLSSSPSLSNLKPIQPKPTILGEPVIVNPALQDLAKKKNRRKKMPVSTASSISSSEASERNRNIMSNSPSVLVKPNSSCHSTPVTAVPPITPSHCNVIQTNTVTSSSVTSKSHANQSSDMAVPVACVTQPLELKNNPSSQPTVLANIDKSGHVGSVLPKVHEKSSNSVMFGEMVRGPSEAKKDHDNPAVIEKIQPKICQPWVSESGTQEPPKLPEKERSAFGELSASTGEARQPTKPGLPMNVVKNSDCEIKDPKPKHSPTSLSAHVSPKEGTIVSSSISLNHQESATACTGAKQPVGSGLSQPRFTNPEGGVSLISNRNQPLVLSSPSVLQRNNQNRVTPKASPSSSSSVYRSSSPHFHDSAASFAHTKYSGSRHFYAQRDSSVIASSGPPSSSAASPQDIRANPKDCDTKYRVGMPSHAATHPPDWMDTAFSKQNVGVAHSVPDYKRFHKLYPELAAKPTAGQESPNANLERYYLFQQQKLMEFRRMHPGMHSPHGESVTSATSQSHYPHNVLPNSMVTSLSAGQNKCPVSLAQSDNKSNTYPDVLSKLAPSSMPYSYAGNEKPVTAQSVSPGQPNHYYPMSVPIATMYSKHNQAYLSIYSDKGISASPKYPAGISSPSETPVSRTASGMCNNAIIDLSRKSQSPASLDNSKTHGTPLRSHASSLPPSSAVSREHTYRPSFAQGSFVSASIPRTPPSFLQPK